MFDTLKLVFDTFGKDLMVPVMIFVICMIFKAPAKKAFSSAVLVGVGLKGMTFITTEFGAVLSPLVQQLIATTGLNLKALDIGWQAVASVAYSTDIGMMFIGVGLAKAFSLAVNLEFVAEIQYRALCIGQPCVLSDEQMAEVMVRFKSYGQPAKNNEKKDGMGY